MQLELAVMRRLIYNELCVICQIVCNCADSEVTSVTALRVACIWMCLSLLVILSCMCSGTESH